MMTTYSTRVQAPVSSSPTSNCVSSEIYDGTSLKPSGRGIPDGKELGLQTKNCLVEIPRLGSYQDLNKIKECQLEVSKLADYDVLDKLTKCELKIRKLQTPDVLEQLKNVQVKSKNINRKGLPKSKSILRPKKPINFSTYNARTLSSTKQTCELARCATQFDIDVLSIQEHRFFHPDTELKYHSLQNYQLISASAYKNSSGASTGGVAILLSEKAMSNLISIEKISSRVIVAEFNTNPITTFISAIALLIVALRVRLQNSTKI